MLDFSVFLVNFWNDDLVFYHHLVVTDELSLFQTMIMYLGS